MNAILSVLWTACPWRALPRDFPNWHSVYAVFRCWRLDGTWVRVHAALRGPVRKTTGKPPTPTVVTIDSQTVKSTLAGEQRGYDAGKKIQGRKRHLAVDTLGLVWSVVVHAASIQDQHGALFVLPPLAALCPRLNVIFAESAYGRSGLPEWIQQTWGWILQTVLRPVGVKGLAILPHTTETMIYIRMTQLMSRRLAQHKLAI